MCANFAGFSYGCWAGVSLSSKAFDLDDGFSGSDEPLKRPPTILFVLGLLSVVVGILVGAYGIAFADNSTNSKQYIIGSVGYLLTAFTPIVFLQLLSWQIFGLCI